MATSTTGNYAQSPQISGILRVVWVLGAVLTVFLYVAGLPLEYERLIAVGESLYGTAFEQTGISPEFFAVYRTVLDILKIALLGGVGAVIVIRNRRDWVAQLVALLMLTLIAASTFPFYTLGFERGWLWRGPVVLLTSGNWVLLMLVIFLFPDGEFRPSWTEPLAMPLAVIIGILSYVTVWVPQIDINEAFVFWLLALALIPAQLYRFRYATSRTQRQQTKWVFYGMVASIFWGVTTITFDFLLSPYIPVDTQSRLVYEAVVRVMAWLIPLSIFPICVGVAVTRSRLWDVDLVINRSLVGGAITLTLGLVFFGVFAALQAILGQIFGNDQSVLSAGASAIAVAALFNPVHSRVRSFVDRRIYGFQHDIREVKRAQEDAKVTNPGHLTGQMVGDYKLTNVIGRGGMGEVYQAEDGEKIAAIKTVRSSNTEISDEEMIKRFQREARALQVLTHPNIVELYDYGKSGDLHYIAMAYIKGEDLHSYMKSLNGPMSIEEVYPLATALAGALDYAHARGFIHRDIKPANIMLRGEERTPILMDFGIVKIEATMTRLTDGKGIGTVEYMAPEQLVTTTVVDHR
ncbi:MAG: serine/threonine-protein kinase, partial [Chloroflexota bacterium]